MKEEISELELRRLVKRLDKQVERLENIAVQRIGLLDSQNKQIYVASNCLLSKIKDEDDLYVKNDLIDKTLGIYEKISNHIKQANEYIDELIQRNKELMEESGEWVIK